VGKMKFRHFWLLWKNRFGYPWKNALLAVGVAGRGQRSYAPQISSMSYHLVLREAVSYTKYCCSLKSKK